MKVSQAHHYVHVRNDLLSEIIFSSIRMTVDKLVIVFYNIVTSIIRFNLEAGKQ